MTTRIARCPLALCLRSHQLKFFDRLKMLETNLFNINDLTVLLAGFFSLILVAMLVARHRDDRDRNLLLAAFFLQCTLYSVDTLLYWNRNINAMMSAISANFFFGLGIVYFLQGPLLYWCTRSIIYSSFRMKRRELVHLLPAFFYPFYLYAIYYRYDAAHKLQYVHDWSVVCNDPYFLALIWSQNFIVFFYGLLCLKHLRHYISHLKNTGSSLEKIDIRWLKLLIFGFVFITGWRLGILLHSHIPGIQGGATTGYVMGTIENYVRFIFFGGLVAYLLRNSIGFPVIRIEHVIGRTSSLDEQHEQLLRKLRALMEMDKLYLQPNINVERLAARLNISPKLLSNIINKKLNQNFFDMIRQYRIEEVRKRLANETYRGQSISEIMNDCGFNSKSVFNQSFKDEFGVTPSHYRKQHFG